MTNLTSIIVIALTSLIVASPFFLQIIFSEQTPDSAYAKGVMQGKSDRIMNYPYAWAYDAACDYSTLLDESLCSYYEEGYREGWRTALDESSK